MKQIILILALVVIWILSLIIANACEHGDVCNIEVLAPGEWRYNVDIDRCLVPIIQALNKSGIATVTSCCNHFKPLHRTKLPGNWGYLLLEDRLILISAEGQDARALYVDLCDADGHDWVNTPVK